MAKKPATRKRKAKVTSLIPSEVRPTCDESGCLYGILGVTKKATEREILHGYRAKSQLFHPDRNPGDATAADSFRRVQDAFDVLSDPEKKERYDATGEWQAGRAENNVARCMELLGGLVEQLFGMIVESGKDIASVDLIAEIRQNLKRGRTETEKNLKKARKLYNQAERAINRLRGEDGKVQVLRFTFERIAKANRDIAAKISDSLDTFKAAERYLESVGFDFDKVVRQTMTTSAHVWGFTSSSTA